MSTSLGRTSLPALIGGVCLALLLIACSSSDSNTTTGGSSGSVTVQSKSGTYDVTGSWLGCADNNGAYELDKYIYSGTTFTIEISYSTGTNCSSPPATPDDVLSADVAIDGTKDVSFSSDSATADPSAPSGLTQPVTVTKLLMTVTATTVSSPAVGDQVQGLAYVDDSQSPAVYYRDAGNNGSDGYPDFVQTIDTLIKQ